MSSEIRITRFVSAFNICKAIKAPAGLVLKMPVNPYTRTLTPLTGDDREQFILDNQRAFKYGATEEFGMRDNHFEEDGEIISRKTIEKSIESCTAYRIREDGRIAGGLVLRIDEKTQHNHLDLLFISPEAHSRGIHFYVNKCGFHIVEFFNSRHPDPDDPETGEENSCDGEDFDGMFRFEKLMK